MKQAAPDFGTDDPAQLVRLIGLALAALLGALFLTAGGLRLVAMLFLVVAITIGTMAFAEARACALAKPRLWDRLVTDLDLRGDETALDAGCGRGLVLCTLARHLPDGHAVGVDLWRTAQQSGNHPDATRANLRLAGVDARAEVRTGDVTALAFDDATFDVVTASMLLSHLSTTDRRRAVAELVRVLRPGGRLVLVDRRPLDEAVDVLTEAGTSECQAFVDRAGQPYPRYRVLRARR